MHRSLLLSACVVVVLLPIALVNSEEKKFAPSYCLRFKLNCQSEQKKKHVCCLHPLPEGADAEEAGSQLESDDGGSPGAGGVKIRPIRLPQREKTTATEDEDNERTSEPVKRPSTDFKRTNTPGTATSNPNTRGNTKTSVAPTVPTPAPKRPRICIRLVVNCNSSPDHRCCKYAEEDKEEEEASADGDGEKEETASPAEHEEEPVEEVQVQEELPEEPIEEEGKSF